MLLVVDDQEETRRMLARFCGRFRRTLAASDAHETLALVAKHEGWSGFLVDHDLGGGRGEMDGLQLVDTLRATFPSVPAAIVTGNLDARLVNRAYGLGIGFLGKPFGLDDVEAFFRRVVAAEHKLSERVTQQVDDLARRCGLTARNVELLSAAVAGLSRDEILARLAIAEGTYKHHVGTLLRRCDAISLEQLAADVLRGAVLATAPPARSSRPPAGTGEPAPASGRRTGGKVS